MASASTPEELIVAFIAAYAPPQAVDGVGEASGGTHRLPWQAAIGGTHLHEDEAHPGEDAQAFLSRLSRALIAKTQ